ncbi:glutamate racemase [Vibrio caribbeanicus]|uniref:glutamate racemase n=1 Tax=Vibrio caribbeanicus TaxID=701175 RepID=UPI00228466CE|nr:glutamate racemase [Vibrio caribbeanicus]MCY9846168.1 glutamate racemase [Vibrio caribbeanicus]
MSQQKAKLLIFDSGVGGLSVYQEIQEILPHNDYIYLFDNAAYPYGELKRTTLINRVERLVTEFVEQHNIDLVVIACNTASTIVLPMLRARLSIPVVGVVPAIKPASNLANKAIGLIATPATITRQYTRELINDFSQSKPVEMIGSTRLVDMAEEKLRGADIDLKELEHILGPMKNNIDVAVLGCTHFPLIKNEIQSVLGSEVLLIDSGVAIARRVESLLTPTAGAGEQGQREIYSTAPPWKEKALNVALTSFKFDKVRHHPFEI